MSNTTVEEIEAIVTIYFRVTPSLRKYRSAANEKEIVARVCSYGVTPSGTAVMRAIQELVSEGRIARADGGNATTDAAAARAAEEARIKRIADAPLTERDFNLYVQMHPDELAQHYHAERAFAARYDRACQTWGFRKPGPPAPSTAIPPDAPSEDRLTAKQYNLMPAREITQRYRCDARFKADVDLLIRQGQI